MLFFEVFTTEHGVSSCPGNNFYYRAHKKLIKIRLHIKGFTSITCLCNKITDSLGYYRLVLERDLTILKKAFKNLNLSISEISIRVNRSRKVISHYLNHSESYGTK